MNTLILDSTVERNAEDWSGPAGAAAEGKDSYLEFDRQSHLDRIFARPLWDETDIAVILDVQVDTIRHMKSRGELPAVVHLNKRCWRVSRDAFIRHFEINGASKNRRGRPVSVRRPQAD
jgi:hypothetical protein